MIELENQLLTGDNFGHSFFGEQDGDFQIDLQAIGGRRTTSDSLGARSQATRVGADGGVDHDRDHQAANHEEDEDDDDLEMQKRKAATRHQPDPVGGGSSSRSQPRWRRLLCGLL